MMALTLDNPVRSPESQSNIGNDRNINPRNASRRSVIVSLMASFVMLTTFHILKIFRDAVTYVIRGGLGTLTFCIDQVISLFQTLADIIPGFFIVSYALRIFVWILTMMMWVVYTALELIFYLPAKLLIVYIIVLCFIYAMVPDTINTFFEWMFWLTHGFFHFLKKSLYDN